MLSKQEASRCHTELRTLEEQERTLLHRRYEGRVSDKLYKEEQFRIAAEREAAEAILARLALRFDDIDETLDLALDLTNDIQAAYIKASPTIRRLLNGQSSTGSRSALRTWRTPPLRSRSATSWLTTCSTSWRILSTARKRPARNQFLWSLVP